MVKDSILFADCVVGRKSKVDLTICDKRVRILNDTVVGTGSKHDSVNTVHPDHLYTGISLVGKEAVVPQGVTIGRNCIIKSQTTEDAFTAKEIADGEIL